MKLQGVCEWDVWCDSILYHLYHRSLTFREIYNEEHLGMDMVLINVRVVKDYSA